VAFSKPEGSIDREKAQQNDEDRRYGLGLRMGSRQYRAWVGPPEDYDLIASIQVSLLLSCGLREIHHLLDVGCGSLRAGRMIIPYLRPGHYFGIEPNEWLVEEGMEHELGKDILEVKHPTFRFVDDFSANAFGIQFDFALAQSVFSHTYPDLASKGLRAIAETLAPEGKLFATFIEGRYTPEGSGWVKAAVPYRWERMRELVENAGMVARRLDWPHPRQKWFVAAHPGAEHLVENVSRRLRYPLRPADHT
jgi:SAM-dependent methyltransferase